MALSLDDSQKAMLREASSMGEDIYRSVTGAGRKHNEAEAAASGDAYEVLRAECTESPIKPFWIAQADSVIFFKLYKRAFFTGKATGEGFIISRMPSSHESLLKWSAPCFINICIRLAGLSFGSQNIESFTCCLNSKAKQELCKKGRRNVSGVDAALSFGTQVQDKADVLSAASSDFGTVGVNLTRGTMFHVGYGWGSIAVDEQKNAAAYGEEYATASKLLLAGSRVEAPREMMPLYSLLNSSINTVERVTPPARVSASLERMTAGRDPDRHMVLPGGFVINDELNEPPKPVPIPSA